MRSFKFVLAALLGLAGLAAVAQQVNPLAPQAPREQAGAPATPAATPAAAESGTPQLTAQDVNAWLDGFMPFALGKGDIAGAVVTVVRNGQVITERGFGYADVA